MNLYFVNLATQGHYFEIRLASSDLGKETFVFANSAKQALQLVRAKARDAHFLSKEISKLQVTSIIRSSLAKKGGLLHLHHAPKAGADWQLLLLKGNLNQLVGVSKQKLLQEDQEDRLAVRKLFGEPKACE